MLENLRIRFTLLLLGLLSGCVLAFVLNVAWYLFKLIVLGYGHSAPESFIRIHVWVETTLIIISIIICLIASQWFYHYTFKKDKDIKGIFKK